MAGIERNLNVYGNCANFRTVSRDKVPFGKKEIPVPTTTKDGERNIIRVNAALGVCTAKRGLSFGLLTEYAKCRQKEGVYVPKSSPA